MLGDNNIKKPGDDIEFRIIPSIKSDYIPSSDLGATGVKITDTLPPQVNLTSWSATCPAGQTVTKTTGV